MQTALLSTPEISHPNMLRGMLTDEVEFFATSPTTAKAITGGGVKRIEEIKSEDLEIVTQAMAIENPSMEQIEEYIAVHHGGLDDDPDISSDRKLGKPEYSPFVKNFDLGNGYHLTPMEIRVIQLIELPNKLIADQLFISIATVESHWQNIRTKTGLANKVQITRFATRKGII